MKMFSRIFLAICLMTAPLLLRAEDKPAVPGHTYHLQFRLSDVDENGKIINTRTYVTTLSTGIWNTSIRTGTKVPVHASDKGDIQYLDLGVGIDASKIEETEDGRLSLKVKAEVSSLTPRVQNSSGDPVIRQNRWESTITVISGKPTVIFSSDNLEDKGKLQLELTATPEK
jgi:hypothetical protein